MPLNPFDTEVVAVEAELRDLELQLAAANAQFNSLPSILRSPGSAAAVAFEQARNVLVSKISDATSRLRIAKQKRDQLNKSAGDRIAAGESPESAYANSSASALSRAVGGHVLSAVLIAAGVGVILWGVVQFIRWKRSKK